MKKLKLLLVLLCTFVLCHTVSADEVTVDDIKYSIDWYAKTAKVIGKAVVKEVVDIPASITYDGYDFSVTSIGDYAFKNHTDIRWITIPESVTSLGDYCFYACWRLTSIVLPEGLTSLGDYCFMYCRGLTYINIPESVTSLGEYCFYDCTSLTSVTIQGVTSLGWACFKMLNNPNNSNNSKLTTIYCRATTPPSFENSKNSIFPDVVKKIYVPSTAYEKYKSSWSVYADRIVSCPGPFVESLSLDESEIKIVKGQTKKLTATILPSNASNTTLTWTSSNPFVANVDAEGNVTGVKYGTATVKVTATDELDLAGSCSCTVTVIPDVLVNSIALDATEADVFRYEDYQLNATVLPEDAEIKSLTWSSSNKRVATVDQNGLVTTLRVGTSVITATATDGSGVKASCTVNVKPIPVSNITLNETEVDVLQTLTHQLSATVSPSNAEDGSVTWSSSKRSVATVDQNGLVTAVKAGTAIITAKANDGSGMKASCTVNVKPVTINLSTKTVSLMEKQTYSEQEVSVQPESYEHNYVTWSTSDASVATINSAGTITAVSPGIATITYALDYNSDITAECRVIVYDESVVYVGGLYYILDAATKTATVTSIYGKNGNGLDEDKIAQYYSGTISIPSTVTYDGVTYDVTNVGQYAFVCQNDLQSLYIPASVVNVERYAATSAKNLQLVNVADGSQLETISLAAFKDCVGLRYFTFDGTTNQMKSINNYAFYGCSKLQRVKWTGSTTLHTIADYAFYKCTALNNFTMPNTVTSVGSYSFRYDSALKKITLSSALNIINEYAFGECGFSEIVLPESLGSIQAGAFINNSYLTSITIPAKVQGIGSAAFENNAALATVSFRTSISTMTIGDNAFNECPVLNRVNIDHLDSWAQTNFSNVKANPASTAHHLYMNDQEIINAELPAGTKYVNNNAFNGCSSIKSVLLPATTDHINDDIFVGCSSLTDVYCFANEVPAFIGTGDPDNMSDVFQRATLHVPFGTESDYKADDWWGRFYRIAGFDLAGISSITADEEDGASYYQLGGVKLASKPQQEGVYIRVKDGKSQKIVVRKK